jgi:hypothetical protein
MPSIGLYFLAAFIVLIIVILSVPSDSAVLYPVSGHTLSESNARFLFGRG